MSAACFTPCAFLAWCMACAGQPRPRPSRGHHQGAGQTMRGDSRSNNQQQCPLVGSESCIDTPVITIPKQAQREMKQMLKSTFKIWDPAWKAFQSLIPKDDRWFGFVVSRWLSSRASYPTTQREGEGLGAVPRCPSQVQISRSPSIFVLG